MSVESIIKRIIADAEVESKRIIDEALAEAGRIINKARQEATEEAEQIISNGRIQCEALSKSMLAKAHQEIKKKVMKDQERYIEETFRRATEYLSSLPPERYKNIVRHYIKRGKTLLGEGCKIIITKDEDEEVAESEHVTIKDRMKGSGGVVILSEDERVRVDYTFDGLLRRKEEAIRRQIGEFLFSHDDTRSD